MNLDLRLITQPGFHGVSPLHEGHEGKDDLVFRSLWLILCLRLFLLAWVARGMTSPMVLYTVGCSGTFGGTKSKELSVKIQPTYLMVRSEGIEPTTLSV